MSFLDTPPSRLRFPLLAWLLSWFRARRTLRTVRSQDPFLYK